MQRARGYSSSSSPWLMRKTCPSGWRTCISRTFHGSSVGGQVISSPCSTQCLWISSTLSTQIDIQTPLSSESDSPKVVGRSLFPRPPCPFWQRKISQWPEQTPPNVGGSPQSQPFFQPRRSNQAKLSWMFETFRIGVIRFANMTPPDVEGHRDIHRETLIIRRWRRRYADRTP